MNSMGMAIGLTRKSVEPCNILGLVVLVVMFSQTAKVLAKSYIESCSSADRCSAFVSYRLELGTKLSEIAELFSVDAEGILGANNYDLTLVDTEDFVIPSQKLLRIPMSCACVNGIRRTDSTSYSVKVGDTLYIIATQTYSSLVTTQQIQQANDIADGEQLSIGQSLIIPFPCACHDSMLNGKATIFLTYAVDEGDSLEQIAKDFEANQTDLRTLNEIKDFSDIVAGDVIEIPISACTSSFGQSAADYNLMVAQGSYIVTAGGCVQCTCPNTFNEIHCTFTPMLITSCPKKTCIGSNLHIGEENAQKNASGCYIFSCIYGGYKGLIIISRLEVQNVTCQGMSCNLVCFLVFKELETVYQKICFKICISSFFTILTLEQSQKNIFRFEPCYNIVIG
ncbi:hypothetical protein O6H91_Y374900 [Diphasiastrum complanatum]|nr:hypothetical protein O6H91_Y374900 [Diphasiastrum complanatum]